MIQVAIGRVADLGRIPSCLLCRLESGTRRCELATFSEAICRLIRWAARRSVPSPRVLCADALSYSWRTTGVASFPEEGGSEQRVAIRAAMGARCADRFCRGLSRRLRRLGHWRRLLVSGRPLQFRSVQRRGPVGYRPDRIRHFEHLRSRPAFSAHGSRPFEHRLEHVDRHRSGVDISPRHRSQFATRPLRPLRSVHARCFDVQPVRRQPLHALDQPDPDPPRRHRFRRERWRIVGPREASRGNRDPRWRLGAEAP